MKKLRGILLMLCVLMNVLAMVLPSGANEAPSITINYEPGSCNFSFYKVADVDEEKGMTLASPFVEYVQTSSALGEIDFNDASELRVLATTLEALVLRDGVEPAYKAQACDGGKLVLENVEKGVYLITGEKTSKDGFVYTPCPIFVSVPNKYGDSDGWQYNITVDHTKYEKEELCGRCSRLKVMKLWCDEGYSNKRPQSISVQLLCDGELYERVTLNWENDWSYIWEGLSAEHDWVAVEENIPGEYSMTVEKNGETFVIKNTYEGPPPPELPQTGQLWWPVPVMLLLGLVSFTVGWLQRKYL